MPNSLDIHDDNPYRGRDPESLTPSERAHMRRLIAEEGREVEATWRDFFAEEDRVEADASILFDDERGAA